MRSDVPARPDGPVFRDPLTGGLETHRPPHRIPPSFSPDLDNVVLAGNAVQKRGGFRPLIRQHPNLSTIRNEGYHARSRSSSSVGAADTDYLIVPGCLVAGHRTFWDDSDVRDAITLDFWYRPSDLTPEHGGNANPAAATYPQAPFDVRVRPLLSKGPVKRTGNTAATGPGGIAWTTTRRWGPNGLGQHAMPFCVFLYDDTATGDYSIAFGFHYLDNLGVWQRGLLTLDPGAKSKVEVGTIYHILAGYDISGGEAQLRVGYGFESGTPTYQHVTFNIPGGSVPIPEASPCPIQLFDCPQEWIEAPSTPSATRPPGLGLTAAANGGYHFASKRAEGDIEDVTVYRGYTQLSVGTLDRATKERVDPDTAPLTVLQSWAGEGFGEEMVAEVSGKANHMYRTPSGPVTDLASGGAAEASWFFNGQTAYAMAELTNEQSSAGPLGGNPNWRYGLYDLDSPPGTLPDGTLGWAMKNGAPHGLEVAVWVDSVEPNFEQVLAEIHSVMRVAIDTDGSIIAYARGSAASAAYGTAVRSVTKVETGSRYHIVALRRDTALELYVNDAFEATLAIPSIGASAYAVGGLTFGMGCVEYTSDTQELDDLNTDSRSGFCGRMEFAAVLVGGKSTETMYRRPDAEDYQIEQARIWSTPQSTGTPTLVAPRDHELPTANIDTVANIGPGHAYHAGGIRSENVDVTQPIEDSGATVPTRYTLGENVPAVEINGARALQQTYARSLQALGLWVFNLEDEDPYPGSYDPEVETFYNGSVYEKVTSKAVWVQRSAVFDQMGFLNRVQRRCIESDLLTDTLQGGSSMRTRDFTHRLRPYWFRSPRELQTTSGYGLLRPLLGTNPIAMVADWQTEQELNRHLIVACRRSVLWAKGARKLVDSPFPDETTTRPLWFFGQQNDYCLASGLTQWNFNENWGTSGSTAFAAIDLWINPQELDGNRILLLNGQGNVIRYALWLEDGAIHVIGTHIFGGFWEWAEGTNPSSSHLRHVAIKANQWNHVQIEIGNAEVVARVNGQIVPMADLDSVRADAIDNGDIPAVDQLWIGGVDETQEQLLLNSGSGTLDITWKPFRGFITEVHETPIPPTTYWPAGGSGSPPKLRHVADQNTRYLFHAAADEGWRVDNLVGSNKHARVNIRELVPIATDLRDTVFTAYDQVVYRNEMVLTNGVGFPQVISFMGYDKPEPFKLRRLGIQAPGVGNGAPRIEFEDTSGSNHSFVTTDSYSVFVSFVGSDGIESEPDSQGVATPAADSQVLHLFNMPRSSNPDVVARKVWVSVSGASAILAKVIYDNVSRDVEVRYLPAGNPSFQAGLKLPAPKAKRVAVGQGVIVLAGLSGVNQNSFAVSGTDKGYFPFNRFIVLDSKDGKPVLGVSANIGNLYIHKRDAVYAYRLGSAANASGLAAGAVDIVNGSSGCAGGTTTYDNITFGANTRGVWRFDGSNVVYASESLEGVFPDLDLTDQGLLAMQGAYYWKDSQYWLSCRLSGERWNTLAYVLHTTVGDGQAWTKCSIPPHVAMASVNDPDEQEPLLVIGTIHGQLLVLEDGNDLDGVRDLPHHHGDQIVRLIPLTSTPSSLTTVSAMDDAYYGWRGCPIVFYNSENQRIEERVVTSNERNEVRWDRVIPGLVSGDIAVIGAYQGYWTSGWVTAPERGMNLRIEALDIEFEPSGAQLIVDNNHTGRSITQREWYPVDQETRSIDMTEGFIEQPMSVKLRTEGRYHRIRFRTDGVRKPFRVSGWGYRGGPGGIRGGKHSA